MGGGAGFARTRVGGAIARVVDAPPAGTGPGEIAVAIRGIDPGLEPRLRAAVEAEGGRVAPDAGTGPGRALVIAPAPAWPRLTASSRRVAEGTQEVFDEIARALGAEGDRSPRTVPGAHRPLRVGERTLVMGVVNVTPDSFSDPGRYLTAAAAVEHGLQLAADGAAILDIGGESTRPGAEPVSAEDELERVVPVIEELHARAPETQLSIDTSKAVVAEAAVRAGATLVNDVTALRGDPEMARLVADTGVQCCLMHMLGTPRTMQQDPRYEDVVAEVKAFLEERLEFAVARGIRAQRVWLDPGIGFGKTVEHNLELLRRVDELVAIGPPVVIGTSRKSFLGRLTGRDVDQRVPATIATNVLAFARGARVFRVHDVAPVYDALMVAAATVPAPWMSRTNTTTTK